jgi:AraC family transcriptional regulator
MHHTDHDKGKNIAIHRVLEYIQINLGTELPLEKLAGVANYSPFHFQRLFLEYMGETPKQYIIRLRLERLAHYLKVFPHLSITNLVTESGFSSPATFSRAFKNYFGITAEEYRNASEYHIRKNCKDNRKNCKKELIKTSEFWIWKFSETEIMEWNDKMDITIKPAAGMKIAYVVTTLADKDAITHAFREITDWAQARMLIQQQTKFVGMLLDIPLITPLEKCRYRAGITVSSKEDLPKGVEVMDIHGGKYASYQMKGNIQHTIKSLVYFKHFWLDNSGFQLKDITGFEIYDENPALKPAEQINRELLIPVKSV